MEMQPWQQEGSSTQPWASTAWRSHAKTKAARSPWTCHAFCGRRWTSILFVQTAKSTPARALDCIRV